MINCYKVVWNRRLHIQGEIMNKNQRKWILVSLTFTTFILNIISQLCANKASQLAPLNTGRLHAGQVIK